MFGIIILELSKKMIKVIGKKELSSQKIFLGVLT